MIAVLAAILCYGAPSAEAERALVVMDMGARRRRRETETRLKKLNADD
jgi:hypothetical protein